MRQVNSTNQGQKSRASVASEERQLCQQLFVALAELERTSELPPLSCQSLVKHLEADPDLVEMLRRLSRPRVIVEVRLVPASRASTV
jgi:hypothetical protein